MFFSLSSSAFPSMSGCILRRRHGLLPAAWDCCAGIKRIEHLGVVLHVLSDLLQRAGSVSALLESTT